MKATALIQRRVIIAADAFVEIVVWSVPKPVLGSFHVFKYRLAYVVAGDCVLRYDNESGKGDHKHIGKTETRYIFKNPDSLVADFLTEVERWNHENGRT